MGKLIFKPRQRFLALWQAFHVLVRGLDRFLDSLDVGDDRFVLALERLEEI
ncbi:hypothetical protein [uncultured Sphingomonas sp.]|uniref:hypothetical protein n=1 Tax=uncultured Sphingomonas sp. TaxID=158754 RepID=UPI0035CA8CFB